MSFLKFDSNPENILKLRAIYDEANRSDEGEGHSLPSDAICTKLLQNPLTRVSYMWCRIFPQSALSPFSLAGITRNPPRDCIKQMKEEETFTTIDYCGTVELPVCFISYAIRSDMWPIKPTFFTTDKYDEEMATLANEEKEEATYSRNYDRTFGSAKWENRTLEKMLKRWGGKSWRKHCRRVFDPYHASDGNEISPFQWRMMKKVYFLTSSGRPE